MDRVCRGDHVDHHLERLVVRCRSPHAMAGSSRHHAVHRERCPLGRYGARAPERGDPQLGPTRAAFHWSGGKDSALALSLLLAGGRVVVDRLVTTVHPQRNASTVHGIPVELLQAQADSIGIPLQTIPLPGPGLDGYVATIETAAREMHRQGVDAFAFGDLPRSGVRRLKEAQFGPLGLTVLEPLWDLTSQACMEQFLASGLRAVTVVVDAAVLGPEFVGNAIDRAFLARLPTGLDPCGELGEFHSFVHDGPLFRTPIKFTLDPPRALERVIATTDGPRRFTYWLTTPRALEPANA